MFLGSFVSKNGRKYLCLAGECHVHAGITPEDVQKKLDSMSNAEFVVHPECSCTTPMLHDIAAGSYEGRKVEILSTEGMMKHVTKSLQNNLLLQPKLEFYIVRDNKILTKHLLLHLIRLNANT